MTSSISEPIPVPAGRAADRREDPQGFESGASAGTYVVLEVGGGRYGLDVGYVHGVVPIGPVTRVPGAAAAIRGVINVRGRVLPLGDLVAALDVYGEPPGEPAPNDDAERSAERDPVMAVLLSLRDGTVPEIALLGEVLDVVELDEERMEPPPPFGLGGAAPLVTAVAHLGDGELALVLHPGRLLAVLGVDGEGPE